MKKLVKMVLMLLAAGSAFSYEGFDSTNNLVTYKKKITQFAPGHMGERMSLSKDGKKVVFSEYSDDIKNNKIYIYNFENEKLKKIKTPYGYKNHPIFVGDKIFMTHAAKTSADEFVDGIYFYDLNTPSKGWTLWEKGDYRDLSTDYENKYIAYSTGNWRTARVKSKIYIQPIDKSGAKTEKSYQIASNFKGQTYKITFSKNGEKIFFGGDKKSSGQSSIFITANKENSDADLLIPNASNPSIYLGNDKDHIIMFLRDFSVYIYSYEADDDQKIFNGKYGNYVGVPTFGSEENFYFRIQYYPGKAALFKSTIDITDYF